MGVLLAEVSGTPSAWVARWAHLLPAGGRVLDVACGSGRHVRWLSAAGFKVTGVDRDEAAVAPLRDIAEVIVADIEAGPWPLPGRRFDGIVITNYLWRPLWPALLGALAEGGMLICETFADGQQHIGRPTRPEFLLERGELLRACTGLRVVAYEDGFDPAAPRFVQRIVAAREASSGVATVRYGLAGPGG